MKKVKKIKYDKAQKTEVTPDGMLWDGLYMGNIEMVRKALERGANINSIRDSTTPLFYVIHREKKGPRSI